MKSTHAKGNALAILAAALYAVNSPFSKLLLDEMPSTLMAGFLYIGAGIGMGIIALLLMIIGAWLCAEDKPIFKNKKLRLK